MEKIRILLIEDDEDHAFLEKDILNDELDCEVRVVPSKSALNIEDVIQSDIILLDFNLPDATGKEVLSLIRGKTDVPVIIITGDEQMQTAIDTLKGGATDFLVKSPKNIAMLPRFVERILKDHLTTKLLDKEKKEKELLNTKIETLRQVLTTLAHYINNSTTTIFGYAQLCQQDPNDQRRSDKLAKISIKETKKITLVLQELERFVNSMEIKTTNYVNIPDAMFAIEESIKAKMKSS
jgi:FixJ family two-component response regulator